MRRAVRFPLCLLLVGCVPSRGSTPPGPERSGHVVLPPDREAEALAAAFHRRHAGACTPALAKVADQPLSPRAAAWRLLCDVREDEDRGVASARAYLASHPNDPWSKFALASVLAFDRRTVAEAARVLKGVPREKLGIDGRWIDVVIALQSGHYSSARAHFDELGAAIEGRPELRVLRVWLQIARAKTLTAPQRRRRGLEAALREARRVQSRWPDFVDAYRIPLELLVTSHEGLSPVDMAARLAELTPDDPRATGLHWWYLLTDGSRSFGERKQTIREQIEAALRRHRSPEWLGTAIDMYDRLGETEVARALEDELLAKHPGTVDAEALIYKRLNRARQEAEQSTPAQARARRIAAWRRDAWAFLERPAPRDRGLDGLVSMALFFSVAEDDSIAAASRRSQLVDLADRMLAHLRGNLDDLYLAAPRILLEKAEAPQKAAEIAAAGLAATERYVRLGRRGQSDAELDAIVAEYLAPVHATIGWVAVQRGDTTGARASLAKAVELDPRQAEPHLLLARLDRQAGDLAGARRHLLLAYRHAAPPDRYAVADEIRVFLRETDQGNDVEEFVAAQERARLAIRRSEILATREHGPALVAKGDLVGLSSEPPVRDEGQIVIVNVWATWCGPCVREMPQLAELSAQYSADPDVHLFTVATDLNPDEARYFLDRHGYDLPTYHDAGFAQRLGIQAYPTTLVFDRDGTLAFRFDRVEPSQLAEEVELRVDALR